MTITLILIVLSVAALLVLLRGASKHYRVSRDAAIPETQAQVDIAAFRNLVDPMEENYLREQLRQREFRAIQRQRMRAALDYVRRTAENATLLSHVGEAARHDPNPEIAEAGQELANQALHLRINAMLAIPVLYARILLPGSHVSVGRVIEAYESLAAGAVRLTRLQNPAYAATTNAGL